MPYRRNDSDIWWVSFTDPSGKRVRASSGTTSHSEAKALEAKFKLETHRVKDWGESPRRSFDEVLLTYLKDTVGKKSHSRDLTSAVHLQRHFAGKIMPISAVDISNYKRLRSQDSSFASLGKECGSRKISQSTIAKELWLLSAAIRHVNKDYDWALTNPVSGRVPTPRRGAPKWLTVTEVDALRRAVRRSPHLLDFIDLGLATGMRMDEMLSLEWRRVDLATRIIWFDSEDQKAGVPGSIPLNQSALAVLARRAGFAAKHCPNSPWVFCVASGAKLMNIKKTFGRAAQRAKIKASPHSLRHTFGSRLVQSRVPILHVKDLMRHADIRTTLQYAFLAPDNTRSAVAVLDTFEQQQTRNVSSLDDELNS